LLKKRKKKVKVGKKKRKAIKRIKKTADGVVIFDFDETTFE